MRNFLKVLYFLVKIIIQKHASNLIRFQEKTDNLFFLQKKALRWESAKKHKYTINYLNILFIEDTEGAVEELHTCSPISFSLISQANMVGFSLLYCSILATTWGVATFGFDPPIIPGGRKEPA